MKSCRFLLFPLISVLIGFLSVSAKSEPRNVKLSMEELNAYANEQVIDAFSYSGLANFYNGISAFIVAPGGARKLDTDTIILKENQWLAIVGHYRVLVFQKPQLKVSFDDGQIQTSLATQSKDEVLIDAHLVLKSELNNLDPTLDQLRFVHLWAPLRVLCLGINDLLLWINSFHFFGWGITIIVLSIVFKIFILPANILLVNAQRKVSRIQAKLAPDLDTIKAKYSGQEAPR